MNTSKQFKKLPNNGKVILTAFQRNRDKAVLFASIIGHLETQKTLRSKQVRLSMFRGLLRNYFGLSEDDMKPIETTTEQKQAYHDAGRAGFDRQHKDTISEALIMKIMGVSNICKLLIQSGLRVGELFDNEFRVVKGRPEFKLNKKKDSVYHHVHIMGNVKIWIDAFRAIRREYKGMDTKGVGDRLNVKLKLVIPDTFYKRSTHICRAIYANYVNKFVETRMTLPQVISKYLNHDSLTSSVYYNHIVLDNDVSDFLRTQKLIIVRGATGAGKTTYVKNTILKGNPAFKHMETDMCYKNGFNLIELPKAHNTCFKTVKLWLEQGHSVVVSNTFVLVGEFKPYLDMAGLMGLCVVMYRIDRDKPKPTHGGVSIAMKHRKGMVKLPNDIVINNNHLDDNEESKLKLDDEDYIKIFQEYKEEYPEEYAHDVLYGKMPDVTTMAQW